MHARVCVQTYACARMLLTPQRVKQTLTNSSENQNAGRDGPGRHSEGSKPMSKHRKLSLRILVTWIVKVKVLI